jgi:hypothetical protein
MKKIFLVLSFLTLPYLAFGALSPAVYEHAKSRASDVMLIKTGRVIRHRLAHNRVLIKTRARVLRKYRSSSRRRVQWITIRYITTINKSSRKLLGGPVAVPVLRSGQTYKAYLNRIKKGYYYTPAAGSRSFVTHHQRKRREIRHKRRFF